MAERETGSRYPAPPRGPDGRGIYIGFVVAAVIYGSIAILMLSETGMLTEPAAEVQQRAGGACGG